MVLKPTGEQQAEQADLATQAKSIRTRQQSAIMGFQNTLDIRSNISANWDVNAAANEFQDLVLQAPKVSLLTLELDA